MKNIFISMFLLFFISVYAADETTTNSSSSCPISSSSITITKDGRDLTFDPAILNQSVAYQSLNEKPDKDKAQWFQDVVKEINYDQTQVLLHALSLNDKDLDDYLNSLTPLNLIVVFKMAEKCYLNAPNLHNQAIKLFSRKLANKEIGPEHFKDIKM